MARIIVELTNRCNLRCGHCYGERHAATGEMSLTILEVVLREGKSCGIDHLCFSGGEPTLHPQFETILNRVRDAGYTFSFVTNGSTFRTVCPLLLEHRASWTGVTFSLDGAREETHDRLRGQGSYRQVMRAATRCLFNELPFTFNMVVTSENRNEIEEMADVAVRLGCGGVRFGHLMGTPETASSGLDLSPAERRAVEARISALRAAGKPVGMAPGYFSESPFFPCAPLEVEEFNLDYRGNVTLCCHLSGHPGVHAESDVLASLVESSLADAVARFRARVATYLADKRDRVQRGEFGELDHFPCVYCLNYMGKAPGERVGPSTWQSGVDTTMRNLHVYFGAGHDTPRP